MPAFFEFVRHRGLLAALLLTLAGPALAEVAGRVTFVSGEARLSSANGSTRALQRGDLINSGDRLSTGANGRLQLRFTDGSFYSLQPGSEFGVDEYLYANRKPEESSMLLSLLKGGMRTLSGAIGKVNQQSYKVRTPVATIGIRGTEYLASLSDDGLKVSVGSGFVNVANSQGSVTAGPGQNIAVPRPDSAPGLSLEKADVGAAGVNEEGEEERRRRMAALFVLRNRAAIGDIQDREGNYVFLFKTVLFPNGPGYTLAYGYVGGIGGVNAVGGYNDGPLVDGSDNSLSVLFAGGGMEGARQSDGSVVFSRGQAQEVPAHGGATALLRWGAWAPSDSLPSSSVVIDGTNDTISNLEYVNYVVGRLTPASFLASTGLIGRQATYTYLGGTPVFATDGTLGRISSGSTLTLNFGLGFSSLNVNIGIEMLDEVTYNLSQSGLSVDNSLPKFASTVSCSDGVNSCGGTVSGFLAGDYAQQIGIGYKVSDPTRNRAVTGAAAFGRGNLTLPPLL